MLQRKITATINIDIPVYVQMKERAEREQRSLSSVARELIQRGLDREQRNDSDRQQHEEEER